MALFTKLRQISTRVCVADWDSVFTTPSQSTHAQAILLQVVFAKYNDMSNNFQPLITKEVVRHLLIQAGWNIPSQTIVYVRNVDDSR